MTPKPLVAVFLAAGCIGAAAGGAYVAVRQNSADRATPAASTSAPVSTLQTASTTEKAVSETEGVVKPVPPPTQAPPLEEASAAPARRTKSRVSQIDRPRGQTPRRSREISPRTAERAALPPVSQRAAETDQPAASQESTSARPPVAEPVQVPVPQIADGLPAPPEPEFVQVVLPAASVIGLHVETAVSSEHAHVEDRVDARVTRDVSTAGRVAIPAGSRVIGSVILVERGGKLKERARLGVRFHTLVFADGSELPIRTDAIFREGESPGGESARKIGGATVGGAILGAIIGGGKGAVIGGATGAAGGTAVVMAGDRNAASLPAGTIVTVRLAEPVTVDVEKRAPEVSR